MSLSREEALVRLIRGAKAALPNPYTAACLPARCPAPEQLAWVRRKLREWERELAELRDADNAEHARAAMRGVGVYL